AAKAGAGIDQGPAKTQPGAGGDEDRGQFEEAVGQYEAEEGVEPARRSHQPEADAQVEHVLEEDPDHRQPEEDAQDEAEGRGPGVVRPDLGGERRGGDARVVGLVLPAGAGPLPEVARGRDGRRALRAGAEPAARWAPTSGGTCRRRPGTCGRRSG